MGVTSEVNHRMRNSNIRRSNRFELGDRVFHIGRGKYGKIIDVINRGDAEDIRAQGYRYYVEQAGWTWSVPESFLRAAPDTKIPKTECRDINGLQGKELTKTPKD